MGSAARFGHLEIMATDVEACVRFYVDGFGLEIEVRQGPDAVWLRAGPVSLLIRRGTAGPGPSTYVGSGAGIVLYTDDLPGSLARLRSCGITPVGSDGPGTCPLFRDPVGNWIQLVDPREPH